MPEEEGCDLTSTLMLVERDLWESGGGAEEEEEEACGVGGGR